MKYGAIIMSFFGGVWWIMGTAGSGNGPMFSYGIACLVAAAIAVPALRLPDPSPEEGRRAGRIVGIASALEGTAIGAAYALMSHDQARAYGLSIVALIVGVHFLPLARWIPVPLYYLPAAALIACGSVGLFIQNLDERMLFIGAGSALTLWLTSAFRLVATASADRLSRCTTPRGNPRTSA